MTTEQQQRKLDLFRELRARERQFDDYPPQDTNGRQDVLHAVRAIEAELGDYDRAEFEAYCKREDAADIERREAARTAAYERTGICT